jgi:hypothetical protein
VPPAALPHLPFIPAEQLIEEPSQEQVQLQYSGIIFDPILSKTSFGVEAFPHAHKLAVGPVQSSVIEPLAEPQAQVAAKAWPMITKFIKKHINSNFLLFIFFFFYLNNLIFINYKLQYFSNNVNTKQKDTPSWSAFFV